MIKCAEFSFVVNVQSPTQNCRSLPSQYNSADLSGCFKNLELWGKSKMNETNGIVIKIDVQKRRFCSQEPRCYKTAKKYGISWVLYFLQ